MRKKTARALREARESRLQQQRDDEWLQWADAVFPGGLRGSAFHEASHAVVSELLSFPVEYISIIPNVRRKIVVDGMVGLNGASTQLVLNESGVVPISSAFRSFCYNVQGFASIPTEKRLGILTKESVAADMQKVLDNTGGSEDTKMYFAKVTLFAADTIVNNEDVWAAITEVAETVLKQHRISGDVIRAIMQKSIPSGFYTTETEQTTISADVAKRGVESISEWLVRFEVEEVVAA
jgi:hypothetical protein